MSRPCPCGAGTSYEDHCRPIHDGRAALTAEELMRSRYSAHAVGDAAYLSRSWHTDTRPDVIELDTDVQWLGLEVHHAERGRALDADGTVDFTATYERGGRRVEMRELSRFARQGGRWVYLDGVRPV